MKKDDVDSEDTESQPCPRCAKEVEAREERKALTDDPRYSRCCIYAHILGLRLELEKDRIALRNGEGAVISSYSTHPYSRDQILFDLETALRHTLRPGTGSMRTMEELP